MLQIDARRAGSPIRSPGTSAVDHQIAEMIDLLETHPAIGGPARFLNARSVQGRERAARAAKSVQSLGLPHLREYVLKDHVVLYACSNASVVLLVVRQRRQLEYRP